MEIFTVITFKLQLKKSTLKFDLYFYPRYTNWEKRIIDTGWALEEAQ